MYIMLSHPSLIMVIGILNALFGLGIDYGNIVTLVIVFGIEMVWAIAWMMMFRKMNLSIVRKLIIDME